MKKYRCPFCKAKLKLGKPRLYETLTEHIMDPNGEYGNPGERPTWECDCILSEYCWWGFDGRLYTDLEMSQNHHHLISVIKNSEAINSLCWEVEKKILEKREQKQRGFANEN
jgi:hypothetical protein